MDKGIVSKDSTGYDACVSQYRAVCSAGIQRKIYKFHYAQGGEETIDVLNAAERRQLEQYLLHNLPEQT